MYAMGTNKIGIIMRKKNRNLLYALPIAEVDEAKLLNRTCKIIGHNVEKFNLAVAAEYKGIIEAFWECWNFEHLIVDGEEASLATIAAWHSQIPVILSFAFRNAHGIQRFRITEIGKNNKPNTEYDFSVTDFEVNEDSIVFFGTAKNSETHEEKEYLTYLFLDQFAFFKSDIQVRKLRNAVYFELSQITEKRLATIIKYGYKYLKRADEVRLSKQTELLTGERIRKPGKRMFIALNNALQSYDLDEERQKVIEHTLETAFHRFVQTSRERKQGLYVQDNEGVFQLNMEEIRPCADKKGLRCQGLRSFEERPWDNYQMNLEYDFKENTLSVFDKSWNKVVGRLTWEQTANNLEEIKNFRRCINSFQNAKKHTSKKAFDFGRNKDADSH